VCAGTETYSKKMQKLDQAHILSSVHGNFAVHGELVSGRFWHTWTHTHTHTHTHSTGLLHSYISITSQFFPWAITLERCGVHLCSLLLQVHTFSVETVSSKHLAPLNGANLSTTYRQSGKGMH